MNSDTNQESGDAVKDSVVEAYSAPGVVGAPTALVSQMLLPGSREPSLSSAPPGPIGDILSVLVFSLCFFTLGWVVFHAQAVNEIRGDLPAHMKFVESIVLGQSVNLPHRGFHYGAIAIMKATGCSVADAAVDLLAFCLALTVIVGALVLKKATADTLSLAAALAAATLFVIVGAIYLPTINPHRYIGVSTPNQWHNPTTIVLKPLALSVFAWFPFWLLDSRRRRWVLQGMALSALLVLSVTVKPNFALSFLPSAGVWIVLTSRRRLKDLFAAGLVFLPCVLVLLWQNKATYGDQSASAIRFGYLRVWHLYAASNWQIASAIVQAAAFPMFVLLLRFTHVRRSPLLVLAWVFYGISLAAWACLYEDGPRLSDGNFGWGYSLGIWFLFLYSIAEYVNWVRNTTAGSPGQRILQSMCGLLLGAHFAYGLSYLIFYFREGRFL